MIYIFLLFCYIYIFTVKVYSLLFQLTGISKQKSLFQVASILTSTGFSTKESEIVTVDVTRRKLVFSLMIFGYVSTIIFIALVISLIINKTTLAQYIIICLYTNIFYLIINTKFASLVISNIVTKLGNKFFFGEKNNSIKVLSDYGNKVIAEISINELPLFFEDISLKDTEVFKQYDLNLLSIKRKNVIITSVNGDHIIKKDDKLVLYGDLIKMTYIFQTIVKNDNNSNIIQ